MRAMLPVVRRPKLLRGDIVPLVEQRVEGFEHKGLIFGFFRFGHRLSPRFFGRIRSLWPEGFRNHKTTGRIVSRSKDPRVTSYPKTATLSSDLARPRLWLARWQQRAKSDRKEIVDGSTARGEPHGAGHPAPTLHKEASRCFGID